MKKLVLYKVAVEDLSHLGGPMGSEYTTPLGEKVFKTPEEVVTFVEKDSKRKIKDSYKDKDISNIKKGIYFDLGWRGYDIKVIHERRGK